MRKGRRIEMRKRMGGISRRRRRKIRKERRMEMRKWMGWIIRRRRKEDEEWK